jgi:hypothetical protein
MALVTEGEEASEREQVEDVSGIPLQVRNIKASRLAPATPTGLSHYCKHRDYKFVMGEDPPLPLEQRQNR